ncbi:hypothetical protein HDU83_006892, partial [Entophlyctis luteolus]
MRRGGSASHDGRKGVCGKETFAVWEQTKIKVMVASDAPGIAAAASRAPNIIRRAACMRKSVDVRERFAADRAAKRDPKQPES